MKANRFVVSAGLRFLPKSLSGKSRWCLFAALAVLLIPTPGYSLKAGFSSSDFRAEDESSLEKIAGYPASERKAALLAAGYPEELLEIQKIQQNSADEFAALLDPYPREEQEKIWNLVRYRELAKDLARGGKKTNAQLNELAKRYPSEDREAIVNEGRNRFELWVKIYALELETEQTFFSLLSPLPPATRDAFDSLTENPELTSLLIDNMAMTTVLGSIYREDPAGVEAKFAAMHEEVKAARSEQERAWAEEVADPEAADELKNAAQAFADEYGYEIYDIGPEPEPARVHVTHYVNVNPYPYWYGYPYWYDVAYWYPRPIWGHVGFHFGYGHGYVRVGLPSPLFLDWYHVYYAPRHYSGYYYGYGHSHHGHHGHKKYRHVKYYEKHRPHYSKGHRRHHDARGRRASHNPRRHNEVDRRRHAAGMRELGMGERRLRGGRVAASGSRDPERSRAGRNRDDLWSRDNERRLRSGRERSSESADRQRETRRERSADRQRDTRSERSADRQRETQRERSSDREQRARDSSQKRVALSSARDRVSERSAAQQDTSRTERRDRPSRESAERSSRSERRETRRSPTDTARSRQATQTSRRELPADVRQAMRVSSDRRTASKSSANRSTRRSESRSTTRESRSSNPSRSSVSSSGRRSSKSSAKSSSSRRASSRSSAGAARRSSGPSKARASSSSKSRGSSGARNRGGGGRPGRAMGPRGGGNRGRR